MLGFIKKDLLMIKSNFKLLVIMLFIYIFFIIRSSEMLFIIPFLIFTLFIITFSYDDFNNFHIYASSMCKGREITVGAKYITSIGLQLLTCLIVMLITYLLSFYLDINVKDCFMSLVGSMLGLIIIISVSFPLIFKYGSEKGRMLTFGLLGSIFAIGLFIIKQIPQLPKVIIDIFNNYSLLIMIIITLLFTIISYLISKKIYLRKEF